MAKFIMSIDDVKDMIREKYCLPDSVEIPSSNNTVPNKDDWFDVPKDWNSWKPPTNASQFDKIDVILSDGRKDVGCSCDWDYSWDQSHGFHITKYRKFKPAS